ncbi:MAG: hypothetical protein EP335_03060 [Alphaproteobacteria bacterium]|nr:MAG: hypothetical protein EP335_03060 [Alphaproteobacteria bacterium]
MREPVKFTFDQAFDGGARSRYDIELDRLRQETDQVRNESHRQGFEAGRQEALGQVEESTRQLMGELSNAAQSLFSQRAQLEQHLKTEMVQLAYTIASKLAPALVRTKPMSEIEALIEDCMATANKEPRLVVRVSEEMLDPVNERIEAMKQATSFPGDIVLVAEADFGQLDCRVEWPDGGTERRHTDIQRQIEDAVQRYVMSDGDEAMDGDAGHEGMQ